MQNKVDAMAEVELILESLLDNTSKHGLTPEEHYDVQRILEVAQELLVDWEAKQDDLYI